MNRKVKIGSRDSLLAVRQSELVMESIKAVSPETELSLVTMKTSGDRILNQSLDKIGGKGLFVKELDMALLEKRSDLSIHSLKDMPMEISPALPVLAYSPREDCRDALVLRKGLSELPACPVIGTGSARRKLQAERLYPQAEFKGIRGNIHTRLRKLDSGEYDALILAAAGLRRMGLENRISRYFSVEEIIPSAGQGIIAVQGRKNENYPFLIKINSRESQAMAEAERSFVKILDGGCSSPIAACAVWEEGKLKLNGLYYEEKSGCWTKGMIEGRADEAEKLGCSLALQLKAEVQQKKNIKETV